MTILVQVDAEDTLLRFIGERLLGEFGSKYQIDGAPQIHRNSKSGMKKDAPAWNRAAMFGTVRLALMDMDSLAYPQNPKECPETVIRCVLKNEPKSENFLFRIAVYEAESWLLADWPGIKKYFGMKANGEECPDSLKNAKEHIAQYVPLKWRKRINKHLVDFARDKWNPTRAAKRSKSLRRTLARLKSFPA